MWILDSEGPQSVVFLEAFGISGTSNHYTFSSVLGSWVLQDFLCTFPVFVCVSLSCVFFRFGLKRCLSTLAVQGGTCASTLCVSFNILCIKLSLRGGMRQKGLRNRVCLRGRGREAEFGGPNPKALGPNRPP